MLFSFIFSIRKSINYFNEKDFFRSSIFALNLFELSLGKNSKNIGVVKLREKNMN